jgi:hypothetical protein
MLKFVLILLSFMAIVSTSCANAGVGKLFSQLPADTQNKFRTAVAAPPPTERTGPYSTPMYYLMRKGYTYHGNWDRDPENRPHPPMKGQPLSPDYGTWSFDRARPDIQEEMIRDWVELGLNVAHLNVYPIDGRLELLPDDVEGIENFMNLSHKHGLCVGLRLDALDWWSMHPANPDNRIDEYLVWVKQVATLLKGKTLYYVLGDELSIGVDPLIKPGQEWSVQQYMTYFRRVAGAIKEVDPEVKVSMFAISYGHYALVPQFLQAGYAEVGDAITVNSNDMEGTRALFEEVRKTKPDMMFLSNGVGYQACALAQPQYPVGTPYTQIPTEEEHGSAIAKMMFSWWDLGASTAPYYVSLRNWVIEGKQYPYWYGFFGFEDYVVENDKMSVKRYPGWNALHTVSHTFYNRDDFKEPSFEIKLSSPASMFRAYEHPIEGGSELVMMLWNDAPSDQETEIAIKSRDYRFPVRVDLFDLNKWSDVPWTTTGDGAVIRLKIGVEPVIIRLFK